MDASNSICFGRHIHPQVGNDQNYDKAIALVRSQMHSVYIHIERNGE